MFAGEKVTQIEMDFYFLSVWDRYGMLLFGLRASLKLTARPR